MFQIHKSNCKPGIAIHPNVKVDEVNKFLHLVDIVVVMTVVPGFGGQKFIDNQMHKISILREIRKNKGLKFEIEIDGGINFENAKLAKKAGVDILVSGTTIFKENGGNLKKNIELLKTG